MKILKYSFLSALFFLASNVNSQELTEGMIKMEITDVSSDNEQVAAQMEMLKGSITSYLFNAEKSMSTSSMMGGMINFTTVKNNAKGNQTMYIDAMGNKMMVEMSQDQQESLTAEQGDALDDIKVVYDESDTKKILGYTCTKATVTGGEDFPAELTMYVSKDISLSSKFIQAMGGIDIGGGFPLELVVNSPEMSMTFSAVEISKNVDASAFEVNTTGYTLMSFDDFMSTMGGFGGMGF